MNDDSANEANDQEKVDGEPSSVESSDETSLPAKFGVTVGGDITHGLPDGISGLVNAGLYARVWRAHLQLGGFWTPTRSVELKPGIVEVRLRGFQLQGRGRVWGEYDDFYAGACTSFSLA